MTSSQTSSGPDRRQVLIGVGAVGAAGALAACSGGSSTPVVTSGPDTRSSGEVPAESTVITRTSDVPVGGGVVVENKMLVVTQPEEGDFKAFTSTCPHQGCTVNEVTAEEIICPCHNSKFSARTGEVLQGPATVGLAPVSIDVDGEDILSQA